MSTPPSSVHPAILRDLLKEVDEFLTAGQMLDTAWTESFSGAVLRAMQAQDLDFLDQAHRGLLRACSTCLVGMRDEPTDPQWLVNCKILETVLSLVVPAKALVQPYHFAQKYRGSSVARLLQACSQDHLTYEEDLCTTLGVDEEELRKMLADPASHGLLLRRAHGSRLNWMLTGSGAETVKYLQAMQ